MFKFFWRSGFLKLRDHIFRDIQCTLVCVLVWVYSVLLEIILPSLQLDQCVLWDFRKSVCVDNVFIGKSSYRLSHSVFVFFSLVLLNRGQAKPGWHKSHKIHTLSYFPSSARLKCWIKLPFITIYNLYINIYCIDVFIYLFYFYFSRKKVCVYEFICICS